MNWFRARKPAPRETDWEEILRITIHNRRCKLKYYPEDIEPIVKAVATEARLAFRAGGKTAAIDAIERALETFERGGLPANLSLICGEWDHMIGITS